MIANQYGLLRGAYEYFRDRAEATYQQVRSPSGEDKASLRQIMEGAIQSMQKEREGWWNAFAMITAYFSLFEHLLVGCLSFSELAAGNGQLRKFLGDTWGDKYKAVFRPLDPPATQRFHDLTGLAEDLRNPYSHGGHDKEGATMFFALPGIEPIPAVLTDIRKKPQFGFAPVSADRYPEVCRAMDRVDEWLATGKFADAIKWMHAGLAIRFDDEFRQDLRKHSQDFELFLEGQGYWADRASNMEW